jgi:hypothetical protein
MPFLVGTRLHAAEHGGSGLYVFTGPDNGHHRRGNYARRVFRPCLRGRTEATPRQQARHRRLNDLARRPGRVVGTFGSGGVVLDASRPAHSGTRLRQPHGPLPGLCAERDALPGRLHRRAQAPPAAPPGHRAGTGRRSAAVVLDAGPQRLGPHGLRHSHKTWMAEDGIPEILAEQRLGHEVPACAPLRALLRPDARGAGRRRAGAGNSRWRERSAIRRRSPVPLLDNLCSPFGRRERRDREDYLGTGKGLIGR